MTIDILIAEDDPVSRRLIEATLTRWNYRVRVAENGQQAWDVLQAPNPPGLAILDWMMPEIDGLEICRRLRARPALEPIYLILLTARHGTADIVAGLNAGADDYITKPFNRDELRARVQVGTRVVRLQQSLAERVRELADALNKVHDLQELLPICSYCKKVRDDKNYWQEVETYVSAHSGARFSHGICPACMERVMEEQLKKAPAAAPGK